MLGIAVGLAIGVMVVPWPGPVATPTQREIHINARQFAFEPARLRVNRGDQVTLIFHPTDVVHGLYLEGYGVNLKAVPGESAQATFVADRAGKFRYRCSVSCGSLHPFMIGELVVGPNAFPWRASALAIIAALGTVAFLYVRAWEASR
ncbi:MAG: cupredoxin domain-containing protein [Anaerolineae bacterium]|nr:cupredoxin domain-containing protein [Anaerolineae bacterium]